jgi:hypothetical protein
LKSAVAVPAQNIIQLKQVSLRTWRRGLRDERITDLLMSLFVQRAVLDIRPPAASVFNPGGAKSRV